MKHILLMLSIACAITGFAQASIDYHKADSVALAMPKNKYYFYMETAQELAEPFTTQTEKCRAIFRWIANNIKYDHETKRNTEGQDPEVVFKHKKAVCAGYAGLFQAMCQEVKIQCLVISGYAGGAAGESHAWNIVNLDGTWYIMDPTWAAGGMKSGVSNKFIKGFNETYWMADYNTFIVDHQTDDASWEEYIASQHPDQKKQKHGRKHRKED